MKSHNYLENYLEIKDNIKLIELGHSSEIIADFKATLDGFFADENIIGNTDDLYDENFEEFLIPIIDGTSGVMKNNGSLNKAFLYDINKTISNISGKEITLHDFRNEYEDGIQYKGAKGYGVGDLQALINRLYQSEAIDENNTYDKETYAKVMELFAGTTALVDLEIGSISKEFINNFNIILDNIDN